jgi:hypothetical protein
MMMALSLVGCACAWWWWTAAVKPALTLVVVLSLLCGIAILLVLSVLRYHTPFIRRLFRVRCPLPLSLFLCAITIIFMSWHHDRTHWH